MENNEIKNQNQEQNESLNALKAVNEEVTQNIASLEAKNSASEVKKDEPKKDDVKKDEAKKQDTIQKVKKDVVARFRISQKPIDANSYKTDGKKIVKRFSVFSTLDILNRNSDLFHYTKNSLNTILKTIYSPEEINDLMEKTNAHSFENLVSKVERAMKHPTKGMHINNVANNVVKFISELKSGKEVSFVEKNTNDHVNTQLQKYENGPSALVSRISSIYGDNRYYNKVNAYIKTLTPLFVKFENDKEADDKIYEVEQYIKERYNYDFQYDSKVGTNKLTRTIKVAKYKGKMDSCVNMLYSVAKNLKGSQKTNIKMARKLLNKNESNDFLTKKNIFNNYIGVKYTVVDKEQKIKKIFKAHSDTISDIVSTLTTAFMARFVFDSKYYAEIERDLTEQAANKMKYLSFSKDSNEDYWINQLIQERLKLNIAQVCTANNITNANQLLEIYNNNGTVVVNPEKITSIDDLVFAVQYSVKQKVQNKELTNLSESKIKADKKLKNSSVKVKAPKLSQMHNKYLDAIRKTDEYQKYLAFYKKQFEKTVLDISNVNVREELEDIKSNTDKNLEAINELAKKGNLSEEDTNTLINSAAANDAIRDVIKENEETLENSEETEENKETSEEENLTDAEEKVVDLNEATKDFNIVNANELENKNIDELISESPVQLTIDDIKIKEEPVEEVTQLSLFDDRFVNEAKQRELEELNKARTAEIDKEREELERTLIELEKANKKLEEDEKAVKEELERLKNEKSSEAEEERKKLEEEANKLNEEKKKIQEEQNKLKEQLENEKKLLEEEKKKLEEEKELLNKKTPIFKTSKNIKDLTDEELKKKVAKFFYKTIHGANGKVGVVGQNLNYRIIEKKASKSASINDSERLDDPQFKKANKIRDAKIDLIIDDLADKTVEYFNQNKENLPDDINVAKLCNKFVKSELNFEENKTFTLRDLKNCLSVLITESVNPELKSLNLELYTGKKTYKNYQNEVSNLIKGEDE